MGAEDHRVDGGAEELERLPPAVGREAKEGRAYGSVEGGDEGGDDQEGEEEGEPDDEGKGSDGDSNGGDRKNAYSAGDGGISEEL